MTARIRRVARMTTSQSAGTIRGPARPSWTRRRRGQARPRGFAGGGVGLGGAQLRRGPKAGSATEDGDDGPPRDAPPGRGARPGAWRGSGARGLRGAARRSASRRHSNSAATSPTTSPTAIVIQSADGYSGERRIPGPGTDPPIEARSRFSWTVSRTTLDERDPRRDPEPEPKERAAFERPSGGAGRGPPGRNGLGAPEEYPEERQPRDACEDERGREHQRRAHGRRPAFAVARMDERLAVPRPEAHEEDEVVREDERDGLQRGGNDEPRDSPRHGDHSTARFTRPRSRSCERRRPRIGRSGGRCPARTTPRASGRRARPATRSGTSPRPRDRRSGDRRRPRTSRRR